MLAMTAELLERGPILDHLTGEFAAAVGEGRAAFVAGEAGAGKSAVVEALASRLGRRVRLVRGNCDALATPAPLAPIADIAWTVGGELEALIERSAPVHEVAAALLDSFRDDRVIVIEDIHWADAATLDVIRLACRRLTRSSGLLVVTYRDDQIGRVDPLRVLLGEVSTMTGVSRLHVEPLSPDAVAVLAAGSGVDAADLHHQTRGNPFFVTEVLASGGASIPATVSDAVLARAARLSTRARRLLDALAVLTAPADGQLIEAMAGDAAAGVGECCANGLLIESPVPLTPSASVTSSPGERSSRRFPHLSARDCTLGRWRPCPPATRPTRRRSPTMRSPPATAMRRSCTPGRLEYAPPTLAPTPKR
jgi:hypothetical protein